MRKINEVYETNDYNMFSLLKNNREVNKSHVKKLSKSMQKIRLITPIIINEKGQIIDGQHRFHAQKNLNLSIPYVVEEGYGEEEARILNLNTSNWKLHDWVRHYCNLNNNNYNIPLGGDWRGGLYDILALGSYENMKHYCNLYNVMSDYTVHDYIPSHSEILLKHHLSDPL